MVKINNRYNDAITLCESEVYTTLRELAENNKADLRNADMYGADMYGADLRNANMRGANMRGADLRNANMYGADMYGADMYGAKINWNSHEIIAEILRQSANENIEKCKIAGLVLISTGWCWEKWLQLRHDPLFSWAIETLAACVTEGDEAPQILIDAKSKLDENKGESADVN